MTDFYDLYLRQKNQGKPRMEKFWIIFVEHTDGGRHYRHNTLEKAQTEAERLARLPENQGKGVYLFRCIGKCKKEESPIRWEIPR